MLNVVFLPIKNLLIPTLMTPLVARRLIYDKLLSEDSKCYDFVITANLRKSCMLASKRYKDVLEKKKAERTNMGTSLKRRAMVDELEAVNVGNKRRSKLLKNWEKVLILNC